RGEAGAPANCVVIAWGGAGYDEQQLSMTCDPAEGRRVLVSNADQIVGTYADSLNGLLFRRAFEQYRILSQRARGVFVGKTTQAGLVEAAALAERLGFHGQPFSDSAAYCGEREDGLLLVMDQLPHRGLSIRIAGKTKGAVRDAGAPFELELAVSYAHW